LSNFKSTKDYQFDYIIEYKSTICNPEPYSVFYLTNSKDNSYWASFTDKGKNEAENFTLNFYKQGSIRTHVEVNKVDFFKAEIINMDRGHYQVKAISKAMAKKGDFIIKKDTLINEMTCKVYTYEKFKGNNNHLNIHYIIEPNTDFHYPFLFDSYAYIDWKLENDIPNGIFKEKFYSEDDSNEIVESHLKLVGYKQYKKMIRMKF